MKGFAQWEKYLLFEDNAGLSDAIVSYLEVDGHKVVLFEPHFRGLRSGEDGPADLIILDVMLPDGDGFMLARRIRKISTTPILFLTPAPRNPTVSPGSSRADVVCVKPFSMRELVLRVRSINRQDHCCGSASADCRSYVDVGGQLGRVSYLGDGWRAPCRQP